MASLEHCVAEYNDGPDPNTLALIQALAPLPGRSVLEIGCGTGILSAWMAARGANVTGIDVSSESTERAAELAATLGLEIDFIADPFPSPRLGSRTFERIAGRYVLHHLALDDAVPAVAGHLAPGGIAAFVETMATNPMLRVARRFVGRFGIPQYGTADERPLRKGDLELLRTAVGTLRVEVAEMRFLRILDRQLLKYRYKTLSKTFGRFDDALLALGLKKASYHQVLVLTKD